MNTHGNLTMFNPFDGASFIVGTFLWLAAGTIAFNSPVLATAVGAVITGIFVLAAKVIELWWKSREKK
jgi:hypothetical protein